MSIATEISRLQTSKADIKTAIENKGVTVPSSATLDTYDTYIDQITQNPDYIIYRDEKHYIMGASSNSTYNYFDLGYHGKNTLRIEGKFGYSYIGAWRRLFGIGVKDVDAGNSSLQIVSGSTTGMSAIVNGNNNGMGSALKNNSGNYISIGQRGDSKFSIGTYNSDHNWAQQLNTSMQSSIANTNLMLFQGYENSSDPTWQVAHFTVYDAPNTSTGPTTLIHEYGPAIRTSDGQVGLWDDVDEVFLAPTINDSGKILIREYLS